MQRNEKALMEGKKERIFPTECCVRLIKERMIHTCYAMRLGKI